MKYSIPRLISSLNAVLPIEYWVGVPDTRLATFIDAASRATTISTAPREDLAVAAAFGASLAGRRAAVYMKDAGLGHCLDAVLTTFRLAQLPLTMLISTTRSRTAEVPLHHRIWGSVTTGLLTAIGIPSLALSTTHSDDVVAFVTQGLDLMAVHAILADVLLV